MALWREGSPARAVLRGKTRGYRHHPQLEDFAAAPIRLPPIDAYLREVLREADARGYHFDLRKLGRVARPVRQPVRAGQFAHTNGSTCSAKLRRRYSARWRRERTATHDLSPLWRVRTRGHRGVERVRLSRV